MRVIAIDPGVTTGFCYATLLEGELKYFPFQMVDDVDDLWRRLEKFTPRHIVIEDFKFRQGKQRTGINLFPVQLIGVARLYSVTARHQCYCQLQGADIGKSYYTDPILKKLKLYKRGIPHAMDATRHLLTWCMFGPGNQYIGAKSTEDFATLLPEWREDAD